MRARRPGALMGGERGGTPPRSASSSASNPSKPLRGWPFPGTSSLARSDSSISIAVSTLPASRDARASSSCTPRYVQADRLRGRARRGRAALSGPGLDSKAASSGEASVCAPAAARRRPSWTRLPPWFPPASPRRGDAFHASARRFPRAVAASVATPLPTIMAPWRPDSSSSLLF
jgi:hypothetical protein